MNKRGIISDYLPWILLALAVLAILVGGIIILKERGIGLIDAIKNAFSGSWS